MPAPNTIAYTDAKASSDAITLPVASVGVTASAVRMAVDDPRLAADLGRRTTPRGCRRTPRATSSSTRAATRRIEQAPAPPAPSRATVSSNISVPSPTIMRKA